MTYSIIIILILSVILHELGHGYCALLLGDTTARDRGRLTMNPLAHIDLFTTLILPAILIAMGLPALGGAKPVPVNPANFLQVSPRRGMMLVGAAGPLVNFVLGILALACLYMLRGTDAVRTYDFLLYIFLVNMNLMAFNLLPVPPLDGSKVLLGLVSKNLAYKIYRHERMGLLVVMLLVITRTLDPLFNRWMNFLETVLPAG